MQRKKWSYYNDSDPKVCEWARELIRAGEVPDGEVDCRPIHEVQASEIEGFAQHHFFCGILGWALALRLAGWAEDKPVATASLPCQPFSAAGKQEGAGDDRHLWPVFFNLAKECGFERIFGEQVAQAIGFNWLDGISADLEAARYTVGSIVLGAHSLGAPHRRQRLYWMANADRRRSQTGRADSSGANRNGGHEDVRPAVEEHGPLGVVAVADGRDASAEGLQRSGEQRQQSKDGRVSRLADVQRAGLEGLAGNGDHGHEPGRIGADATRSTAESGGAGAERLGNPESGGCGERRDEAQPRRSGHAERAGGPGLVGVDDSAGPRCNGTLAGTEGEARDETRVRLPDIGCPWSNYDIIPCRDGKARRIESGTFPLANGIPGRVGLLRGYGNAIVPQVAAQFIQACEEAMTDL